MLIKELEDLKAWQEARKLTKIVYDETNNLPKSEEYNIKKHMRECARSAPGNIAEGFGRYHLKESSQFYRIAKGSLEELKSDTYICLDNKFLSEASCEKIFNQIKMVSRLNNGLIGASLKLQRKKKSSN